MPNYRNYIRQAAGFNGVTAEIDDNYTDTGKFVWTGKTTGAVGIFSPTSLGRSNVASLARVMLQGTVDPNTDTISVVDSSGATRFSVTASIVSSGFLFLGPQDKLKIVSAAATKADILINDLDSEALQSYLAASIQASAVAAASSLWLTPISTAVDPFVLPDSISGKIQPITTTGAAAQTVTLPLSSAVDVGTQVYEFNSSGNAHEFAPTGGDLINGANAVFAVLAGKRAVATAIGTGWTVMLTA